MWTTVDCFYAKPKWSEVGVANNIKTQTNKKQSRVGNNILFNNSYTSFTQTMNTTN